MDPSERTLPPGPPAADALGDFRVVARIGEGTMGTVYRAHQKSLDRDVALKILPAHLAGNAAFVERFVREARLSVKLDHPNIVRGVAVGEEGGVHYFAMELVDGESLDRYLRRGVRLPVGAAVRIVTDVARALEHAHARGVLHRDVKPANIMVTRDGRVKLADLGLARLMDDDSDLTRVGEGAGTPTYMPLEQARSARNADRRSDVYALGATLYHLLAGERPFTGATAYEVLRAKETGRYEPASRRNPEVPPALDRIVATAMASSPEARYQDMGAMIAALEATGLAAGTLALGDPDATQPVAAPAAPVARPRAAAAPGPAAPRAGLAPGWILGGGLALLAAGVAAWLLVPRVGVAPPAPPPPAATGAPAPAAARADAEPVDLVLARAIAQVTRGDVAPARETLERGLRDHPGAAELERPRAELAQGVLVLFQYQTPEETSPIIPMWRADGVTLTRRDNYRVALVPGRACHVYVFQRDTRPSVTRLFPNPRYSPRANPLPAGALRWVPDDPDGGQRTWLHLDTSVGEERVFVVAVTRPLPDPDALGQRLLGSTDAARRDLAQAEPCFAAAGGAVQGFAFQHK